MIFRIYPIKDTFITNDYRYPNYTRLSASNLGHSEELDVFKRSGISGAAGMVGSSSLGRTLIQFDLSQLTSLTASGDFPSFGITYRLRMNHKTAACGHPTSFDLVIRPLSSSWDEGTGRDVDDLVDKGYANWDKRTSALFWNTPGADVITSLSATQHFDQGTEDLDVDITQIVNSWLSGTFTNNGLLIAMTASIESDAVYTDYYQKKFYSRHTNYQDRAPYIEARVDASIRDDRSNMYWGRSGSLFLYNIVGGVYQNLSANNVYVTISDSSGVLARLTASVGILPGIYSATFALPTGSYSGSVFYDSWGSGSYSFMTSSFSFSTQTPVQSVSQKPLVARIKNIKSEYTTDDVEIFDVFFKRQSQTLSVVQTASLGVPPFIVEQAYYAIENDATRERVIPFGTGSQNHTKLSYGANGNSFKLYMSSLHASNVYRIIFLVYDGGRQQIVDNGFKFKVI